MGAWPPRRVGCVVVGDATGCGLLLVGRGRLDRGEWGGGALIAGHDLVAIGEECAVAGAGRCDLDGAGLEVLLSRGAVAAPEGERQHEAGEEPGEAVEKMKGSARPHNPRRECYRAGGWAAAGWWRDCGRCLFGGHGVGLQRGVVRGAMQCVDHVGVSGNPTAQPSTESLCSVPVRCASAVGRSGMDLSGQVTDCLPAGTGLGRRQRPFWS